MTTAPDVNTVIYAANALFRTVSGIKRVFDEAPDTVPSGSGDLPCVIPVSASVQHIDQADGLQRKNWTIKFLLLVTPYNKNLVSMEKLARPFADPVLDLFWQHGWLNVTTGEIDHTMITMAEYGNITYNEAADYLGWTFTLTATLKQSLERSF